MKTLLILASNPYGDLRLDREIRDLTAAIERSKNAEEFAVVNKLAVRPGDLHDIFDRNDPYLVHFCGHGAGEEGLIFESDRSGEQLASNQALSGLFNLFGKNATCVLLNACTTGIQANAIGQHVPYVIGTSREILDRAAYFFAVGFYQALGNGQSIEVAFARGCNAIELELPNVRIDSKIAETWRKAKVVGITPSPTPTEPLKIILTKNSRLNNSDLSANIPSEFRQTIHAEAKRKDYYDNLRQVLERFGQTSIKREKPISKYEYEQRQTFLNKVQDFWIEGFLKPSLYFNTAIDKSRDDTSQILRPLDNLEVIPFDIDKSYDELKQTDITGRIGGGKTLLILGDPGSGKTIALLQLAERLIEQTQQDMSKPIPVVFNLSSWGEEQPPLEDWLIEELKDKYQVPKTWSKPWLKEQQLILLLDGLDEVKAELRNACVIAINKFIAKHLETEIVVCSRVKDYEALAERLLLSSAICIQPLSKKQLLDFLENADDSLLGLKTVIEQDEEIAEFAQTPLILNMMTWTYQGWSAEQCSMQFRVAKDRRSNLFESYIDKNLDREDIENQYSKNKIRHYLNWLGKIMVEESKTVFLIEKMQSSFLSSKTEKNIYHILVGSIVGLVLGIAAGTDLTYLSYFYMSEWSPKFIPGILLTGILSGLISGFIFGILDIFDTHKFNTLKKFDILKYIKALVSGIILSVSNKIILQSSIFVDFSPEELSRYLPRFVLVAIISSAIYSLVNKEIKPLETVEINSNKIQTFSTIGLIIGIIYVLIKYNIQPDTYKDLGFPYMIYEIIICVIVLGIIGGFQIRKEIAKQTVRPNEGIKRGKRYALISFAIVLPIASLTVWVIDTLSCLSPDSHELNPNLCPLHLNPIYSIFIGFAIGLLSWLCAGGGSGIVLIQHLLLRFILHRQSRIPWNYAQFLDSAKDFRLLKKVGGGYIFYHRMLMEHFARKKLD